MRTKFIAGNWKMYTTAMAGKQLAMAVAKGAGQAPRCRIAVCPPFPYLAGIVECLKGSPVDVGAQNCYVQNEGAFTGEVGPAMLVDIGCKLVILGHSERRQILGETDALINRKVQAALAAKLEVILCIGETLEEREKNQLKEVCTRQIEGSLAGISAEQMSRIVIAYEPVWAIGTGRTATPEQAQEAHHWIRGHLSKVWNGTVAERTVIQYGGSVKPENAASLLKQPDVDGALVGGASLKVDQFLPILDACQAR